MKPCARLSGLCGLAALVAGLVAINFLATHASAFVGNPCAGIECGPSASCMVQDDGTADCWCEDGSAFNKTDKTCYAKWIAGRVLLACKSLLIPTALLNACATITRHSTKRTRHATTVVLSLTRSVAPMLPVLRIAITIPSASATRL
ncbi:unnamed protein product, partial [Closterium sp. Naga37s-1]